MTKNKISIIIPVYNGEKYLERCIKSVLNQTYSYYEIIIVDDGSTDKTEQISKEFTKKYDCIKYFRKKNGGVSSARNFGLDNASGNYVLFLDHDDYLDYNYIEELLNFAEDKKIDIVRSGYKTVDSEGKIINKCKYMDNSVIIPENYFKIFLESTFFGYAGGVFISMETINDTRFNSSLKFAEDLDFIRTCFKKSGKMGYLNNCGYNYFVNLNGMTKKSDLETRIKECQDNIEVFSTFINYEVPGSLVLASVYQRLNLKLKYLLKTTSIKYSKFKIIVEELYDISNFKKLREKYNCYHFNADLKNRILIYFLQHKHFNIYYKFVKIYHFMRK